MWIVSRNMSNKFKSFVLFLKILVTLVLSRNFYTHFKGKFWMKNQIYCSKNVLCFLKIYTTVTSNYIMPVQISYN